MHDEEHLLAILKKTREALGNEDPMSMKELSNQTIHSASIYQDPDSIAVAVLIYALSKIIERQKYREYKEWRTFMGKYTICLDKSIKSLQQKKAHQFQKEIVHLRKYIHTLFPDFKKQIQEVFRKAEISKASRIYEHGISMQRTSELLGISMWELAEYAGATGIPDVKLNITISESERMKYALEMFRT